jgi:carbonic anhydrase
VQPGSEIMLGGKAYELKQFHFHTPSEHTLDGRPLPMEIHFVHQATDGGIAVIGVLVRNSYRPHPILRRLWRYLPAHPGDHNDAGGLRINPVALLPPHRNYVTYTGSLTTPPCSEGVHWIVMLTPLRTIRQEVDLFAHLIGDNARPVQPLNGRTVLGTRQRR